MKYFEIFLTFIIYRILKVRYLRRRHLIARRLRNYDPLENFENTLGKLEKSVEIQNKMIGNHNPQNVYRSPNSPTGSVICFYFYIY